MNYMSFIYLHITVQTSHSRNEQLFLARGFGDLEDQAMEKELFIQYPFYTA